MNVTMPSTTATVAGDRHPLDEVSILLRKANKNSGLGQLGADVLQVVSDETLAQIGAAAAAGDRHQLLALARELVGASQSRDGDDAEDLLALPVVAGKLDCGTRTVWRLVARKELMGPVHVGGKAKWFRQDVQDYLDRIRAKRDKGRR